jgi:hypothetical protein
MRSAYLIEDYSPCSLIRDAVSRWHPRRSQLVSSQDRCHIWLIRANVHYVCGQKYQTQTMAQLWPMGSCDEPRACSGPSIVRKDFPKLIH